VDHPLLLADAERAASGVEAGLDLVQRNRRRLLLKGFALPGLNDDPPSTTDPLTY